MDLNKGDNLTEKPHKVMEEASSCQTSLPGKEGNYLHVDFLNYNDNRKNYPKKFMNPGFGTDTNLDFKYNLDYVSVNM